LTAFARLIAIVLFARARSFIALALLAVVLVAGLVCRFAPPSFLMIDATGTVSSVNSLVSSLMNPKRDEQKND
jgi:hypothetical protein